MREVIRTIQLKDINFSYKNIDIYKKNVNARLDSNYIYLLKGKNGSGKSTLLGLLMRIWNDFSGEILLNSLSIKDYSREELAEQIGICFQRTPIFRDTIRNNITLGKKGNIDSLLARLEFDRDLAETGRELESELLDATSLSGGQAQKIGILRTLFQKHAVYIFDEATSNLDVESKSKFYKLMRELCSDSIVILISHEKETEQYVDQVIEL